MNEEWPRAFRDLPHLLESRFYLKDWLNGWDDRHVYNQMHPATQLAEPRAAFVRSGGHGPFSFLSGHYVWFIGTLTKRSALCFFSRCCRHFARGWPASCNCL